MSRKEKTLYSEGKLSLIETREDNVIMYIVKDHDFNVILTTNFWEALGVYNDILKQC